VIVAARSSGHPRVGRDGSLCLIAVGVKWRPAKGSVEMARTRSKRETANQETRSNGGAGSSSEVLELTCPECGRTFTRAAALGAHRRRAHGVVGAAAQAKSARGSRRRSRGGGAQAAAASTGGSSTSTRRSTRGRTAATARRSSGSDGRRSAAGDRTSGVNRDALLGALFPGGIPPRADVIRSVNEWLDEAERLAKLR
jgi:hypothetical protein